MDENGGFFSWVDDVVYDTYSYASGYDWDGDFGGSWDMNGNFVDMPAEVLLGGESSFDDSSFSNFEQGGPADVDIHEVDHNTGGGEAPFTGVDGGIQETEGTGGGTKTGTGTGTGAKEGQSLLGRVANTMAKSASQVMSGSGAGGRSGSSIMSNNYSMPPPQNTTVASRRKTGNDSPAAVVMQRNPMYPYTQALLGGMNTPRE